MFQTPTETATAPPTPATSETAVSKALSKNLLALIKYAHFVLGPIGPNRKLTGRQQSANEHYTSANGVAV
jgi:hypothetical protein